MSATGHQRWQVSIGSGDGSVPSSSKPSREPNIDPVLYRHMASLRHNKLTACTIHAGTSFMWIICYQYSALQMYRLFHKCRVLVDCRQKSFANEWVHHTWIEDLHPYLRNVQHWLNGKSMNTVHLYHFVYHYTLVMNNHLNIIDKNPY